MVVSEPEMMSQSGEVESPLQQQQSDQPPKNAAAFPASLGRQSSIYSLTLDEFQHTLCDNGKNFGSMNMDEFLTSIWTAEENQAGNSGAGGPTGNLNSVGGQHHHVDGGQLGDNLEQSMIAKQQSLSRQGSLSLPAPLCRKTVEEVWSEIHRTGQGQNQNQNQNQNQTSNRGTTTSTATVQNPDPAPRQPTFGEMTLEDFLVKAGVVREPPPQQFGIYQGNTNPVGPSFINRPMMGMGPTGAAAAVAPAYQAISHGGGEASGFGVGNGKRNGGYAPHPPAAAVCYNPRVGNGGGSGYGPPQPMAMVAPPPLSPVSSDGIGAAQVDNAVNQFGLDMGGLRGRKRIIDGPVEKVVERRQRRMIKNRESAARSRARKQAYTVELEAELNQLKEENAHLKHALAELERKRKQQYVEEQRVRAQTKAQKAKERLRMMRRNLSCPM